MKIHVITIFPESFNSFLNTSIIWNAYNKKLFDINFYKLNNFSTKKTKRVDEKAYWMAWQVISPEPLSKSIEYIFNKVWKKIPIIFFSPSWKLLNQEKIENDYKKFNNNEFIIICWHYEWIDERILEIYNIEKISIWEYVLTSWELASQVYLDALIRHIPNVLGNKKSLDFDSFSKKFNRQKEYPIYTRPKIFMWKKVPEILLSWNHKKIENWKINNLKK